MGNVYSAISIDNGGMWCMTAGQSDHDFFKTEIATHMDSLYGCAMRLTRNPDDAQDLVAETVTKAWAAITNLQDRAKFRGWIFCILNNTFISLYRKQKNSPEMEQYLEESEDDEPFSLFEKLHQPFLLWWGNPEQEYMNKLLADDIKSAIDGLSDDFRDVVVMVDVQGLSYEEASRCANVPVGTIRSRLKRARTQLQKSLWKQASDAGIETALPITGESK
ncbi:MAG: sigma-70 family RNA polymerase sigma factor [Rhodospirillaceae bacterium]|nr:sigma-70 family RNA polymerase sigma factor [Rhodospirillaceae bacterium]